MWTLGKQPPNKVVNSIEQARKITDDASDEELKAALGALLRYNLGYTWELMTGEIMFPFQEIFINAWFNRDYSLVVAGRGVSKSYSLAMFCLLYAMFYKDTKIVVVANNFRRVKDIFITMDKFIKGKDAVLLRQCFTKDLSRQSDHYFLQCDNGSTITGLPLGSGDNLRGTRANVLIIDEGLLISEHIQKTILQPFLTAKQNIKDRMRTQQIEDELIEKGLMTESERTVFTSNKMIITSSASYEFEYLYKIYQKYVDLIHNYEEGDPSHCVIRMSYKAVPEGTVMDEATIKEAQSLGEDSPIFKREYEARFTNASDSYFNIQKLHACTVPAGELPTVQIYGSQHSDYILAIDPSYSASTSSDFFAMGVYLTVPEDRKIVQVHSYGVAGRDLKEHFKYLAYLLKAFKPKYIVIDRSGTEFIDGFNESQVAKENHFNLKFINADFESDDYLMEVSNAKTEWNQEEQRIVYAQPFSGPVNRRMNEYLQTGINASKVWFGSPLAQNERHFKQAAAYRIPFGVVDEKGEPYDSGLKMAEFIADQDDWVQGTKDQLALIQVKSTSLGTLQFDIPTHLKKSSNSDRPRRDNYTCLLMAYYASKHYFDMMFTEELQTIGFVPMAF